MSKDAESTIKKEKKFKTTNVYKGSSGAIYGLGVIGAAVYYIVHAPDFWMGALGLIKAVFWPAFLIFKVFEMLKM